MFERQPKIITLETIGDLCKLSRKKKPKEVIKTVITTETLVKSKKENTNNSEEIILWL